MFGDLFEEKEIFRQPLAGIGTFPLLLETKMRKWSLPTILILSRPTQHSDLCDKIC